MSIPRFQVVPAAYVLLTRPSSRGTEVLLQLRGAVASYMPHHWASGAAGHVEYAESVAVAAAREAHEELGITLDPAALRPLCALQRTEPDNPDPIEQRVDFFLTDTGDVLVNEVNTMPGFTPHSMYPRMWAATGMSYPDLIDELIALALERRTGLR